MVSQSQVLSAQDVVNEIVAHIRKQGGPVGSWYAGIASNIEQRLFGDHCVPKEHWWIRRRAANSTAARAAEKALLDWGCDGGPGGGDDTCIHVYAYLKTPKTRQ